MRLRRGIDKKQCEVCSHTFTVKDERYSRTCSRKCAAALRLREGTNSTHGSEADRNKRRAVRNCKAMVRRAQTKVKNALRPCQSGLCGNRGVSYAAKWCEQCRTAFLSLPYGTTGYRSLVCNRCFCHVEPRGKYKAGKYCAECEREVAREQSRRLPSNHRARARRYGCEYDSSVNLSKLMKRDNNQCQYCGVKVVRSREHREDRATLDHVVPMAKGGGHTWNNVKLACWVCNTVKGDEFSGMGAEFLQ